MSRRRLLTPEQLATARERYDQGESLRTIAADYGVSKAGLGTMLKREGVVLRRKTDQGTPAPRRQRPSKFHVAVLRLRTRHPDWGAAKIAVRVGCTPIYAAAICHKAGVPIPCRRNNFGRGVRQKVADRLALPPDMAELIATQTYCRVCHGIFAKADAVDKWFCSAACRNRRHNDYARKMSGNPPIGPTPRQVEWQERRQAIIEALDRGAIATQIAVLFGMSKQRVYQIHEAERFRRLKAAETPTPAPEESPQRHQQLA